MVERRSGLHRRRKQRHSRCDEPVQPASAGRQQWRQPVGQPAVRRHQKHQRHRGASRLCERHCGALRCAHTFGQNSRRACHLRGVCLRRCRAGQLRHRRSKRGQRYVGRQRRKTPSGGSVVHGRGSYCDIVRVRWQLYRHGIGDAAGVQRGERQCAVRVFCHRVQRPHVSRQHLLGRPTPPEERI